MVIRKFDPIVYGNDTSKFPSNLKRIMVKSILFYLEVDPISYPFGVQMNRRAS